MRDLLKEERAILRSRIKTTKARIANAGLAGWHDVVYELEGLASALADELRALDKEASSDG